MSAHLLVAWTLIAGAAGALYGVVARRRFDTALWAFVVALLMVGALLTGVALLNGGITKNG